MLIESGIESEEKARMSPKGTSENSHCGGVPKVVWPHPLGEGGAAEQTGWSGKTEAQQVVLPVLGVSQVEKEYGSRFFHPTLRENVINAMHEMH